MDPSEKVVARRPLEREQMELNEKLEAMRRALDRTASIPFEQVQQQVEMAEKQLRALETSSPSQQDILQVRASQKELETLEEKMRALTDKIESEAGQKELLAAQERLMEQQGELEKVEMNLQALNSLHAASAGPHDGGVFFSGTGAQAAVIILSNRTILVSVPFEFPAGQYAINISTISSDGKTAWSKSTTEANRGNPKSLALGAPALPPGSYTMKALVKDTAGPTQKAYVVNFSVK
jgi:hypothetical protein